MNTTLKKRIKELEQRVAAMGLNAELNDSIERFILEAGIVTCGAFVIVEDLINERISQAEADTLAQRFGFSDNTLKIAREMVLEHN